MQEFCAQIGLYTLRLDKFRFGYELTDQSIIISTIIYPSTLQHRTNMLQLTTLMNHHLPNIIENLFTIRPTHSIKNLSEDKTESFITINIPTDNNSDSEDSDSNYSDTSNSDSDRLSIKTAHKTLLTKLKSQFNHFEIRWLGVLEPPTGPTPRSSV